MAASSEEGSTPAMCDACEGQPPVKYCVNCSGNLCSSCAESHAKVKISKDHVVYDITVVEEDKSTCIPSCKIHQENLLDMFCKDCVFFLCETCTEDHQSHKIKPVKVDPEVYTDVSRKFWKSLVDDIYDLEEYKCTLNRSTDSFAKAANTIHKQEADVIEYIREEIKGRIEELGTLKDNYETSIREHRTEIDTQLTNARTELAKLNSMKLVKDVSMLPPILAHTQELVREKPQFKSQNTRNAVLDETDILPSLDSLNFAKESFRDAFETRDYVDISVDKENSLQAFTFPKIVKLVINKPRSEYGYKFSSSNSRTEIVMHGRNTSDIRVLNVNLKSLDAQYTSEVSIWNMVTTAKDEHVAIDNTKKILYLLDGRFKKVASIHSKQLLQTVSYISPHRFMLVEFDELSSPKKTYMTTLKVNGLYLILEQTISRTETYNMTYACVVKGYLYQSGILQFIQKVNLENGEALQFEPENKPTMRGIYFDASGNLVVNNNGHDVCMYDRLFKHRTSLNVTGGVRDLSVRKGCLFVTTDDGTSVWCFSSG